MKFFGFILQKSCVIADVSDINSFKSKQESEGVQAYLMPAKSCFINPEEHPEAWKFVLVSKFFPFWYKKEDVEKRFRAEFTRWWNQHVIINEDIPKISKGYFILKNCNVSLIRNAIVDAYDTKIAVVKGSGCIRKACGSTEINSLMEKSSVLLLKDRACVNSMTNTSTIHIIQDHAFVIQMKLHSKIFVMKNNAMVESMQGNSCIQDMQGGFIKRIESQNVSVLSTGIEAYIVDTQYKKNSL